MKSTCLWTEKAYNSRPYGSSIGYYSGTGRGRIPNLSDENEADLVNMHHSRQVNRFGSCVVVHRRTYGTDGIL